jgi:ubiquinone biosynthesis protein
MSADAPADLAWGAFSDNPPWVLDRSEITWRPGVPALRASVAAEVPQLISPSKLPPGVRVGTVAGRLGGAVVPWLVMKKLRRFATSEASRADVSRRLRRAAERLGPTYIKLGQIISSGQGLFPRNSSASSLLRDRVPAEPFDAVRRVVEEDLGGSIESRSLVRSHPLAGVRSPRCTRARLRTGETVVVKVQRPSVATLVRKDLAVMAWLAPHLVGRIPISALANPPALVELFAETITEELDFRLEADNMLDIAAVLAELDQRGYVIPRPHPRLVTRRVLVMEQLSGFAFDDVVSMHAAGIDTEAVVRTGMIAFMEGAMIYGVFHGDLHGGNLFVMPDGRTALLDFGIVGRLTGPRRLAFLRLMLGATTNDTRGQLEALRDLGALPPDTDLDDVMRELRLDQPPVDPTTLTGDELVKEIQRVVKALLGYGARMPKELMLYVKNMVFLDGAIATPRPTRSSGRDRVDPLSAQRHGERPGRELGTTCARRHRPRRCARTSASTPAPGG